MKWVFYALLAINVCVFSWQLREHEPRAVEVTLPPPPRGNVNRLLLLSELDRGELERRAMSGERDRSLSMGAGDAPAPLADGGALPGQTGDGVESAGASAPAGDTVAALDPARGDDAGEAPTPPSDAGAAPGADAGPPVPGTCFSVGPLLSDEETRSMTDWIEANGGNGSLRVDERREVALFWVYFPPLASRQAAVERVLQMRQDDLDDIYIIPRGDMANAISLGVYSRTGSLDRRLRELRTRGYQPSVAPRYRTSRAYWFDARFPDDFVFPRESFGAAFPTAEMVPVDCRGAAAAAKARGDADARRAYTPSAAERGFPLF